jgi:hypothetical protein
MYSAITHNYFTAGSLKRTSQLIFLHQRLMEQGSAAMASRGRVRAAVPVTGCCRHRRPATALVVVGGLTGGERCRRLTSVAARCGWHTISEGRSPRGAGYWMLLCLFQPWAGAPWNPPADQHCSIKYANGLCRRLVFPCPWVPDVCVWCVTWMVCTFALVDFFGYDHAVKCLWKPWSSSFAWNACACACSSCCARAPCEIVTVVNGGAGLHSCPWWCTGWWEVARLDRKRVYIASTISC